MSWLDRPASETQITHRARLWLYALAALVLAFLIVPTLIVIPMSFSGSQYLEFPPRVWSLRWYENYFGSSAWMQATAMARLESGRFLEITGFVVDETQRSGGIGGKMLALVTDFGKENGFERLVVRSNVMRNRAQGFYLKNGFEERKQQKVFEKRIFHAGG